MKRSKSLLIITILFLSIGFAAVATNLFINGNILVGTNEDDFEVYFSNAIIDGIEDLSLISQDKKVINFSTKDLSKVGDKSILEYEVTNASTQYDANVSVTCTPNETDLYKVINTQDKEIIEARSIGNGAVTVELKRNVLEEQTINFTCTITASAGERETSNDVALPTDDTYVLEGTYMDETGKAIPNVNLVVYSDKPHYVTTDASGKLLVSNLERGSHEIYHVNDTLENIKNMTKEGIVNKAVASSNFKTSDNNIVFTNNSSISSTILPNKQYCSGIVDKIWEFDYIGDGQEFLTICDGKYKIELWGAQGGSNGSFIGGLGAYTSGEISLSKSQNLFISVGGAGSLPAGTSTRNGGYNGGGGTYGAPGGNIYFNIAGTGGGATDVRVVEGQDIYYSINKTYARNFEGLKSRIMVAAGGGGGTYGDIDQWKSQGYGAAGGGLVGYDGTGTAFVNVYSLGGTQKSGGKGLIYTTTHAGNYVNGLFGLGGSQGFAPWGGGGAGYYGGGSGGGMSGGGASGSSFISGHPGCDAIAENSTETNIIHTGQPNHYSGLLFTNTKMIDGAGYNWSNVKENQTNMPTHDGKSTMIGNAGNGYAKITYLGVE